MFTKVYCSDEPEQVHSCKRVLPDVVIGRLAIAVRRKDFTNLSTGIPEVCIVSLTFGELAARDNDSKVRKVRRPLVGGDSSPTSRFLLCPDPPIIAGHV
jgi:hypothetical protein